MAVTSLSLLSQFPPDLIGAVVREAEQDALRVAAFLDAVAETPVGRFLAKRPVYLPVEFALGLRFALRLLIWEKQGIQVHRESGLPEAQEALRDVFRSLTDLEAGMRTSRLCTETLRLHVQRFAWTSRLELDADVLLEHVDEDTLVDAVAEFLWNHRSQQTASRRQDNEEMQ